MGTVYIDVLFLTNMSVNSCLLLCTGRIMKLPLKAFRIFWGAIIASLYSCLAFVWNSDGFVCLVVRFLVALAIVGVSFGFVNIFRLIRRTFAFIGITVISGITFLAVLYFTGLGIKFGGIIKNGVFYFNIPSSYLFVCTISSYIIISLAEKLYKREAKQSFIRIKIYRFGKAVELKALVDTGNMLCDPLTGRRVIIAESKMLSPLFSFDIDKLGADDLNTPLPDGLRLIPFTSIGKKNGLLAAFVPDRVEVENEAKDNLIAAVFDGALSEHGDYNALIGPM